NKNPVALRSDSRPHQKHSSVQPRTSVQLKLEHGKRHKLLPLNKLQSPPHHNSKIHPFGERRGVSPADNAHATMNPASQLGHVKGDSKSLYLNGCPTSSKLVQPRPATPPLNLNEDPAFIFGLCSFRRLSYNQRVPEPPISAPINASTRYCAVYGFPVRHSASPPMQNAGIAALGLNWRYLAFEVAPHNLRA